MDKTSILSCSGSLNIKSVQEKIARKSIRMLMPTADNQYLENSKVIEQTMKSKLGSPSPKKSYIGKMSGIFTEMTKFCDENPNLKQKRVSHFQAPKNLELKMKEISDLKEREDSDSDITSP